ncbi:DNA recombination protein RmuC [Beduini massiliensis]|uniref:DNA recombination protein RmuC n=1 Tax=Beduini massiliensis TaxID=1585974 RepID=UPI00059A8CC4|nr:DNA recombination protein RmuC [Beduini massiliensis]
MEYIIIGLFILIVVLLLGVIYQQTQQKTTMQLIKKEMIAELSNTIKWSVELQKEIGLTQNNSIAQMNQSLMISLSQLEKRFQTLEMTNEQKLDGLRLTMEKRLSYIQEDSNKKLEEIRHTVDEKLQTTLEEKMTKSFQLVNERLEAVYKGLGEMQTLANGVGDLKKVLSNVKTRGILGEIQLGMILEEILSAEQYETNVATVPNSKNVVEYAIKLPGDERSVYLPIDSKFPADAYQALQEAYETGDPNLVQSNADILIQRIKSFAKDIKTKYIEPPYTTDFAIMFLPFEGLYAEAVNRGLVEVLQRDYHVNLAGPSTMAALLNSLQMGFRTIALQKRSSEVWEVLGAVRTEFDKFADILSLTQQRIDQANRELDKLVGVRTRAIQRKLRNVEKLDTALAQDIIETE